MTEFFVEEKDSGQRIDQFLASRLEEVSRSQIQKMIRDHMITVSNKPVKANYRLLLHDRIQVEFPEPEVLNVLPEDIPLDILYEDKDLLIVNKPKQMVVHPAPGHPSGTLVNAVLYHCGKDLSGINGVLRPGIVHRIDMDTTGSLIICKSDLAHQKIAEQLKEHSINRIYEAIVHGNLKADTGTINAPIGRDPNSVVGRCVRPDGARAVTHYEVLGRSNGLSLLRLRPETGRTHQLRVHMASIGCPLAGDWLYGEEDPDLIPRPALHAYALDLDHPVTGEHLSLTAPIPADMARLAPELLTETECASEEI